VTLRIIDITDERGHVVEPDWLGKAERVHRELRPHLPQGYAEKMGRVFAGGARMSIAIVGSAVAGVAVHRVHENTFDDPLLRSQGVGKALLQHMQGLARKAGCGRFTLDSGVQRAQAHKFYFREGMTVTSFHFGMALEHD
jgi:GNAT superfamily N-acetyltransferase